MGEQYGAIFASLIDGFYAQELSPDKEKLAYAARCLPFVKKYAPDSYKFLVGMARGGGLSVADCTLLVLHEEIYHYKFNPSHCTGIVVPRGSARNQVTYAAQNWDWQPQLFPWAGLLRMRKKGGGRILSYHYPKLAHCCGLNSRGLSLMWTGGGYFSVKEILEGSSSISAALNSQQHSLLAQPHSNVTNGTTRCFTTSRSISSRRHFWEN